MLKSDLQTPWSIVRNLDGSCWICSATSATIVDHIDENAARVIVDSVNHANIIDERSTILNKRSQVLNERSAILDEYGKLIDAQR